MKSEQAIVNGLSAGKFHFPEAKREITLALRVQVTEFCDMLFRHGQSATARTFGKYTGRTDDMCVGIPRGALSMATRGEVIVKRAEMMVSRMEVITKRMGVMK